MHGHILDVEGACVDRFRARDKIGGYGLDPLNLPESVAEIGIGGVEASDPSPDPLFGKDFVEGAEIFDGSLFLLPNPTGGAMTPGSVFIR
jgi:hypothetical protein